LKEETCRRYLSKKYYDSDKHFCYGCYEGTCEQAAKGDSGSPVVCALRAGDDPLVRNVVFAVHELGCAHVNKKCHPDGPSAGVDVRKIRGWIRLTRLTTFPESLTPLRKKRAPNSIRPYVNGISPYVVAAAAVVVGSVGCYYL